MATKQTSLRLGSETLDQLEYLSKLTGQSQAKCVAELVSGTVQWILDWAARQGMDAKADHLLYRGGTILSVEEQRAIHQLRMVESRMGEELWEERKRRDR